MDDEDKQAMYDDIDFIRELIFGKAENDFATKFNEDNLKAGAEKLSVFYHGLGYRTAEVRYTIISDSTLSKTLIFNINKKQQTKNYVYTEPRQSFNECH